MDERAIKAVVQGMIITQALRDMRFPAGRRIGGIKVGLVSKKFSRTSSVLIGVTVFVTSSRRVASTVAG
jgi:hypothetical protein